MKNFLLIIPARLKSTRLPNKLLLKIKGKEVLKYVWERCKKACHQENIVVATPDQKIILFCKKNNIKFIKTSQNCMTGTDSVIEISVNDEILIDRIKNRAKEMKDARSDDNADVLEKRLKVYHKNTEKIIPHYQKKGKLVTVDGMKSIDEVSYEIEENLKLNI